MLLRIGFHHIFKRHHIIRRGQNLIIFKINLVLSLCNLVVRGLDLKAHFFER